MAKSSDGRRLAMIERQVQEVVAQVAPLIIGEEFPFLITISRVKMPADLKSARVSVSVLAPGYDEVKLKKEAATLLQKRAKEIQSELDAQLKLRFTPKLQFVADESLEKILKVESLIADLGKKRGPQDG